MNYVYNYSLGSIFFGTLTLFFYFRKGRLKDLQTRLFTTMLICAFAACVFDVIAAAMEPQGMRFPLWMLYAVNILFLLNMQTCLPCVLQYSLCASGRLRSYSYPIRVLFTLPYLFIVLCILVSPFVKWGIFYINETHNYCYGATHSLLYANAAFYMIMTTVILLSNFKTIQKQKRIVILIFSGLVFVAMLLQIIFPRYLLTTSASMLAVTAMFYVLQSPLERRDPLTGAYSRMLLPSLVQDYHDQSTDYTLLLFALRSFDQISSAYGPDVGDEVLRQLSEDLRERFPDDVVVYMDTAEFTVACRRIVPQKELTLMHATLPRNILTPNQKVPVELCMAAVVHDDAESPLTVLTATDYLYDRLRDYYGSELLLADAAFQNECSRQLKLESDLERLLSDGTPTLLFDPILLWGRTPCGTDALLKINHVAAEGITPLQLYNTCERMGFAWQYLSLCLKAAAPFGEQFNAQRRIYFPLASFLCMSAGADARIDAMVRGVGMTPAQICFCLPEAQVASALPSALETIDKLAAMGFAFRLDNFAEGYTDVSILTTFPVSAVRIGGGLFSKAARDARQLKLLHGTVDVLRRVGIEVICGSIDSPEDASVAAAADITMIQGAYIRGVCDFPRG
ncbi:MAG: EAL domain-containing protein [Eubacteriales bacterium]|nr:EAL domain-containing protein [Eubacteriales bacterium]